MFRHSWEVQPGMGEAILAGIGADVRKRRQMAPSTAMLELLAEVYEKTAEILVEEQQLEDPVSAYDGNSRYENVIMPFVDVETEQLEKAQAVRTLMGEARRFGRKEYLGRDPDWRTRIEPLESGVVGWKVTGGAGGNPDKGKLRMLEEGEVREGRGGMIGSIVSAPEQGGELTMDFEGAERLVRIRQGIHVTGLVSPENGDPQVDLQIFQKAA